jgi:hypothetical protein
MAGPEKRMRTAWINLVFEELILILLEKEKKIYLP